MNPTGLRGNGGQTLEILDSSHDRAIHQKVNRVRVPVETIDVRVGRVEPVRRPQVRCVRGEDASVGALPIPVNSLPVAISTKLNAILTNARLTGH